MLGACKAAPTIFRSNLRTSMAQMARVCARSRAFEMNWHSCAAYCEPLNAGAVTVGGGRSSLRP